MISFGSAFIVIYKSWTDFKTMVSAKAIPIQFELDPDLNGYQVFAVDDIIVYVCQLFLSTVPQAVSQSDNDAAVADFVANYMATANKTLSPKTSDGRVRQAAEKSSQTKNTIYSPNYCDQTTWFPQATRIVNEAVSQSGDGYYHLAYTNVIDSYHGKISDEDYILGTDGYSLRVAVVQNGITMTEQDPHYATGGDYTINYATGIIYPITLTLPIIVTYHYANGSSFTITPPPGMAIIIDSAECEFSTDIILNDTVQFVVMGYASHFAPQLGLPAGYRIPLSTTKYKTMNDYYNDAVKTYPVYPPLGGPGWRGINVPSTVLNWDYIAATAISDALGMQIVISLEHDTAFGGLYATTTFFTIVESDPNV